MRARVSVWIAAISFFVVAARQMALADVSCFLLPLLRNFLKAPVAIVSEIALLESLRPPVSPLPLPLSFMLVADYVRHCCLCRELIPCWLWWQVSRKTFDDATDSRALRFPDARQPIGEVDPISPMERETLELMEPVIRAAAQAVQSYGSAAFAVSCACLMDERGGRQTEQLRPLTEFVRWTGKCERRKTSRAR